MNEHASSQEEYEELKFSNEQGYFDKSLGIRILIGAIFTIALFLFLHFRETRVEILELNSIAPSYVVAQVDFDFHDEEATQQMRQEAVRDIGKVYQLSENEVRLRRMEFENFLIYNQDWRKYVTEATFEELYRGVEELEKILLQVRFTDQRTFQKIKEENIPTHYYVIYTPPEVGFGLLLPSSVWRLLLEKALPTTRYRPVVAGLIITFFQRGLWTIQEDLSVQKTIRKQIQNRIPEKYTHISAGNRIIDQGEKVTARHIAMLMAMKKALRESRNLWHPLTIAGSFMLAFLLTGVCYVYFRSNHPIVLYSNRKLGLIVTIAVLTLLIAKLTELIILTSKTELVDMIRYPVFVAFGAILLSSLMNTRIATFASGFLTLVLMVTLAFERQGFMFINLGAALVAILSAKSLRRRKEIFVICLKAWICCIAVIFALNFSQNVSWDITVVYDVISTGVFLLLTAVAVVGLLPLLESTFRVMTDVTLTEYLDPNNDLLRRLSIEAPGTYQHSIVVGNIAETAALAIGANGLFCRVATLYHDIGKMVTPQYFTENQQSGMDVHQLLTPKESAEVILAHVPEGVALARKAGLPEQFIDIIKEHHGTSLVYYFYRKQLEKTNGDKSQINENDFRYAGPKPHTKEAGIIMIADTLEAASRSLEKVNEPALTALAKRLIRDKVEDGQFDHCLLTMEELSIVIHTLVKTLVAFGHSRIKYPTREPLKENSLEVSA